MAKNRAIWTVGFEAADEADLREMDNLRAELGAIIEILDGGPVLAADTEEIDAEANGNRLTLLEK